MEPQPRRNVDHESRRRELFEQALRLPPELRVSYLDRVCAGDAALNQSVQRLLAVLGAPSVLDQPLHDRQAIPESIGGYHVLEKLGEGGMGVVYACTDTHGSSVAVKHIPQTLTGAATPEAFERERALLEKLQHPGICRILNGGRCNAGWFLAMELVRGQRIDHYCLQRRLTAMEILALYAQVLDAVSYCHGRQVLHRDLKPSNILVNLQGQAKVLDFGIAKALSHEQGLTGLSPTLTTHPAMTLRYASPEQIDGKLSGRASDIYSLGILLYELLTGRHPYAVELQQSLVSVQQAVRRGSATPPTRLCRDLPPRLISRLDDLVLTAMRPAPAERYSSVGDFHTALLRSIA